jgi:hypothetical protein
MYTQMGRSPFDITQSREKVSTNLTEILDRLESMAARGKFWSTRVLLLKKSLKPNRSPEILRDTIPHCTGTTNLPTILTSDKGNCV